MSVRVNLLPEDVRKREAAGRTRVLLAAAALVLVAVLGVLWWVQQGQIDDARQRLAVGQRAVDELTLELAELEEYADLAAGLEQADAQVATLFAGEVGMAGLLQDVAAVMPPDTELNQLTVSTVLDPLLVTAEEVAGLTATGRTSNRHAPGLERVLLELDKVAAFRDIAFGSAAVDNDGAIAFDVTLDVGAEALTGRYVDGLPEDVR